MDILTIATAGYKFYSEVVYLEIILPEVDGEYSENLTDRPHVTSECLKPKIRVDVV